MYDIVGPWDSKEACMIVRIWKCLLDFVILIWGEVMGVSGTIT